MEKQQWVLSSQFLMNNKVFDVTLTRELLTWTERQTKETSVLEKISEVGSPHVPVSEIIAVEEASQTECPKTTQKPAYPHGFTVFLVKRVNRNRWQCHAVTFCCSDSVLRQLWVRTIEEQLSLLSSRPRRLLVYINPSGGKGKAERIYQQKVAPLFARASVSTHVIVTNRENHARDHLRTEADLKSFDGVVCVGGDGTFSELLHGLVARTQADSGVDQNCIEEKLVPCGIRVGIIPAGSTDCICYATVGTNDPVTSTLHIIVGDCQPLDVCSVHHDNKFLRYSVSLGYGFFGDVLSDSEQKRWMGPVRYSFSGFTTFLKHRFYEGTVSFQPAPEVLGSPRDKAKCRAGCSLNQHCSRPLIENQENGKTDGGVSGREDQGEWKVVQGKFLAINVVSMCCACPRSPQGLSPTAHLADGTLDLILIRECSRLDFLGHLLRLTSEADQFDLAFLEVHRVRRVRFRPKLGQHDSGLEGGEDTQGQISSAPGCSSWNCDGEVLSQPAIEARAQHGLVRLFARGIEDSATPCAV